MLSPSVRFRRTLTAAAVATIAAVPLTAAGVASAHTGSKQPAVTPHSRYLALGDSISFGYKESNSIPAPDYMKPRKLIGFPADVAGNLGLRLTNASCPGETTGSFIDTSRQSNGCENSFDPGTGMIPGGYRMAYPLHATYKSATQSQLQLAKAFLKKYPHTGLVTLMIGANDGFLCQAKTTDGCVSEFGQLQDKVTKHVTRIFTAIRDKAHYAGQLVLVTYYSIDYSDSLDNLESQGLNNALLAAAKPFHVEVADGYGQFEAAAKQGEGNPCTAQLVTALSGADAGTCGVHPSLAGQALLAQAVERAIKK